MKFKILLVWALLLTFVVNAQNPDAKKYGTQITADQLKEYLSIIASDALEGRETGTRGQKMAAAFIAAHFQELGFKAPVNGSYYQPVELYSSVTGEAYLKVGQTKLENFSGIVYSGTGDSGGEISVPVVFAGYGTEAEFNQVDVKDKAVVVLAKEMRMRGNPAVKMATDKGAKLIILCAHETLAEFDNLAGQFKNFMSGGRLSLTKPQAGNSTVTMLVSPVTVEKIFNTTLKKLQEATTADAKKMPLKKFKGANVQYKVTSEVKITYSDNVLGYLEGTDKKDELVVVTAHYDHIGKMKSGTGDLINNGADDDGSGTVSVLAIAKAFAQAKKEGKGPRRSILFMTVTGEEKGLLGSEYYSEHPVFPLASTVVDLNIDMVGRRDPQHKDSAPYVYVIGSDKLSADLHELSERVNKENLNIGFDYTYNDQNHPDRLYYRSDHWNFAKKNIPIVFYFDGIHEDYHKPSDEVSKIEFDLIEKRAQTVFYTAWEIANRDNRLKVDEEKKIKE
ncbi:MAG: M28 family peptidase [Cyclobacteriaceae bacterium]|nr:M28 family peptidase [Cyclobacteriaceae bacterium]